MTHIVGLLLLGLSTNQGTQAITGKIRIQSPARQAELGAFTSLIQNGRSQTILSNYGSIELDRGKLIVWSQRTETSLIVTFDRLNTSDVQEVLAICYFLCPLGLFDKDAWRTFPMPIVAANADSGRYGSSGNSILVAVTQATKYGGISGNATWVAHADGRRGYPIGWRFVSSDDSFAVRLDFESELDVNKAKIAVQSSFQKRRIRETVQARLTRSKLTSHERDSAWIEGYLNSMSPIGISLGSLNPPAAASCTRPRAQD